ncbi:MAG: hypothetical protein ACFB0G_18485 [Leptolyngbyaceae cyanobacterium]
MTKTLKHPAISFKAAQKLFLKDENLGISPLSLLFKEIFASIGIHLV